MEILVSHYFPTLLDRGPISNVSGTQYQVCRVRWPMDLWYVKLDASEEVEYVLKTALVIDWDVVSSRHTSFASRRQEVVTCCVALGPFYFSVAG